MHRISLGLATHGGWQNCYCPINSIKTQNSSLNMAYRGCPVQLPQNKCVRVLMANLVNEALCSHSVNHMCQNAQSTTPFQQQPVKIRINKQYHNFAYFSSFFRTFSFGRLLVMKEKKQKKTHISLLDIWWIWNDNRTQQIKYKFRNITKQQK